MAPASAELAALASAAPEFTSGLSPGATALARPRSDIGSDVDPEQEPAAFSHESPRTGTSLSVAGLAFLRGRDADGHIRMLVGERRGVRLLLGTLAAPLVARRRFEALGFRGLGDYARERMGVSAVSVREWARVAGALAVLPALREAVTSGEVSWSVARRAVAFASAETDAAFVVALRGRTVKAAQTLLRAVFGSTAEAGAAAVGAAESGATESPDVAPVEEEKRESSADQVEAEARGPCAEQDEARDGRVRVRVPLARTHHGRWQAAVELARRMAGEALPVWECADVMAAEVLSALPPSRIAEAAKALEASSAISLHREGERPTCIAEAAAGAAREHGLRHAAFPILRWDLPGSDTPLDLEPVRAWAERASPHALDRALRRANARLQAIDHDLGHVLRQLADRKLYVELGFGSFERYVQERVDVSPRTARRWVQMARLGPVGSAVSEALRSGVLTAKQASLVSEAAAAVAGQADQAAVVEHARGVTLRRLEDELGGLRPEQTAIVFSAPREAASVFLLALEAVRRHLAATGAAAYPRPVSAEQALRWMLDHVIAAWEEQGAQFDDYADFTRDGFRCTAPGCTGRRNLQSHHIVFRSAGGTDEPSNRTTLCAFHHLRGIHAGTVSCRGRAPEALVFALGLRASGPPLLRAASGEVLLRT